ncbi:MAG: IPT/TIG domain-containing protein, partial [Kangiellaceae bacterium]|nr:IPT/TIG domain-containing protein [Kangiellaceae bacterium]
LLITEPLRVDGISPSKGSINGGTVVEIKGAGFHQRSETLAIYFDDIPVASHKFDVVDPETIILTTPKGKLGFVDVKIDFGSGKEAVLVDGFEFLQASQSTIRGDGRIYDITLDPTLTYMFAAAGQNVLLYDMNSARLTSGEGNQLDAEDLLQLIDLNNDGIDDRLLASIAMPQGKLAVSVDGYFERFNDRVFITLMAHDEDGNVIPGTSELQIYSFDSADVSNTTLIKSLALPGNMVGRLEVENNRALVALGDAGIGLVDTYLHTKMYLSQQLQLPNGHSALDIEPISSASGTTSLYAVASGVFNLNDNQLIEEDIENSGAVYIVESTTTGGLNVLGSVAVPASRLEVKGNYIFASSGENGVIVIDASSPTKPVVLNRFRNLGHVYDIELSGNTIYAALGTTGVKTIDVTDVFNPVVTAGMSANKDVQFEAIVATEYSAIAAGIDTSYESEDGEIKHVIQLFSDVILKLHSVDPESRVLDKDAIGDIKLSLHFNKSIALWADNYNRFELLNESGQTVPFDLTIENNDAIFKVHPNSLSVGQKLTAVARAGIKNVKPFDNGTHVVLYELAKDQIIEFTYRGADYYKFDIVDVVPRRLKVNQSQLITVSAFGVPTDKSLSQIYVGDQAAEIQSVTQSTANGSVSVVEVMVPSISQPGIYDVTIQRNYAGVTETAVLRGGVVVDADVKISSVEPKWGPVSGGFKITVKGEGFEPGNSVLHGMNVRIGSMPVLSTKILSSTEMQIIAPAGYPGLHPVEVANRYGDKATLAKESGVGYGIKLLSSTSPSLVFPSDVYVDQEAGTAITSGGYFKDGYTVQLFQNLLFPETTRAATFDIQDPYNTLLVGGESTLPSGDDAERELGDFVLLMNLTAKQELYKTDKGPPLTAEEEEILDTLQNVSSNFGLDSITIQPFTEDNNGVENKRLLVASGNGGIATLNLDEQNGLNYIGNVFEGSGQALNGLIFGNSIFANIAQPNAVKLKDACAHTSVVGDKSKLYSASSIFSDDPVEMPTEQLEGAYSLYRSGDWLYSGGIYTNHQWVPDGTCMLFNQFTAD